MKAFISTVIASFAITMPAMASPLPSDHQSLVNTLVNDGVTINVNYPSQACNDPYSNGMYITLNGQREIIICQDNRFDNTIVEWTDNDLDTLRHEIFHSVQDCMKGAKNDGTLGTVYNSLSGVIDSYGVYPTMDVMENYAHSTGSIIVMEIEAFYTARDYSPAEIETMYNTYCM